MAIPGVAGPSAMAALMLLTNSQPGRTADWSIALFCAWLATALILLSSTYLFRWLGDQRADRAGTVDGHAAGRAVGADVPGWRRALSARRWQLIQRALHQVGIFGETSAAHASGMTLSRAYTAYCYDISYQIPLETNEWSGFWPISCEHHPYGACTNCLSRRLVRALPWPVARWARISRSRQRRMSAVICRIPLQPPRRQAMSPAARHNVSRKGGDIAGDWWTLFHSKPLNDLIEQSLKNNPDLKAAQAALTVGARKCAGAARRVFPERHRPDSRQSRQQDPPGALAPVPSNNAFLYNLFTPQVSVSYVPDVFGLNRRTVESLEAQEQAGALPDDRDLHDADVERRGRRDPGASLQTQIDATRELIDVECARSVEILQYQLTKGYASRLDLAAQESQLAQAKARLPPLLKQLDQLHDLLAVLTGQFPSQAPDDEFRSGEPATAAGSAAQPAVATRGAASRRAAGAKPTCTPPARRSASPSRTACRTSS